MSYTNLLIGILILLLGIPIGNLLAKITREEVVQGQAWFKLVSFAGLLGTLIGLVIGNDTLLFSFAFIAVVSSRSIKSKK